MRGRGGTSTDQTERAPPAPPPSAAPTAVAAGEVVSVRREPLGSDPGAPRGTALLFSRFP